MSAIIQKDSYKVGHVHQYPEGTEYIYSNFTPRSGRLSNVDGSRGVYFVGLQYFILDYLISEWNTSFFHAQKESVIREYVALTSQMGTPVSTKHIAALHDLGYLPVRIKALPEGSFVPYGVPLLTITNTHPDFYWVTNMLETVLSSELWLPITSATTYMAYNNNSLRWAYKNCDNIEHVPYQNHDFSMRGMQGRRAAAISGFATIAMGSLGSDCIPAVKLAVDYYGAGYKDPIAGSVPGTEHSVMCAGGKTNERETLRRLIEEVYPEGTVAVVSDSWDFWRLVTEYLPSLRENIIRRNGKLVIRPDSGDPADIICGTKKSLGALYPEGKGLIECLWDIFGGHINSLGYRVLHPSIGAIYGDSITLSRQEEILNRLDQKNFAASNIIFGVGSYTYSYATRDTHGLAFKSTYAVINGVGAPIFKDPITDSGVKKSAKGLLMVSKVGSEYHLVDMCSPKQERSGCLRTVFENGELKYRTSLAEIRQVAAESYLPSKQIA